MRIVAALLFLEHGTLKLFGFPPGEPYTGFPSFSLLGIAGVLECVGVLTKRMSYTWQMLIGFDWTKYNESTIPNASAASLPSPVTGF